MATPANTVPVHVRRSKKHPNFYFVEGPGGCILSAGPRFDGATGEKDMTQQEVYAEFEAILMMDKHITNPENYETLNTYLSPDNMPMYAELDMRKRTVTEMKDRIIASTKG